MKGDVKQGTGTLFEKRGRWFIALPLTFKVEKSANNFSDRKKVMGIDLGLREIAVASIGTKSIFFNGREVAYKRRRFASLRKRIEESKKYEAIRNMKDKESRWIRETNHKISRKIINFALENGVHLIRMENLKGIQFFTKTKKEPGRSIHRWAHYQLQLFIRYKAEIAGIEVQFVNPNYTSQACKCGYIHKDNRDGNAFLCKKCAYKSNSDLNAAINISKAISGVHLR